MISGMVEEFQSSGVVQVVKTSLKHHFAWQDFPFALCGDDAV